MISAAAATGAVPGMRNFFGRKLGQSIMRGIKGLSPIDIHHGSGARVTQSMQEGVRGRLQQSSDSLMGMINESMRSADSAWQGIRKLPQGERPGIGQMVSSYFHGKNVMDMALEAGVPRAALDAQALRAAGDVAGQKFRMKVRAGVFGGLGLYTASNFFLGDRNPVSRTLSFTGSAAANVGVGYGLGSYVHPMLGTGYLAWTAINAVRGGDNFGPM